MMRFLANILACTIVTGVTGIAMASVTFENIRDSDKKNVEKKFGGQMQDPSPQLAENLIKALMETGAYTSIQVYDQGDSTYLVSGETFSKVGQVVFNGLNKVDEIDALNALAIKPGSTIDTSQVEASVDSLREVYGRNGYFNPEIDVKIGKDSTSEVPLTVNIKENEPCRIESVVIHSPNKVFATSLQNLIKNYRGKIFSERNLGEMETEMRDLITSRRMLSARLLQKEAAYNAEKTKAYLTYELTDPYAYRVELQNMPRFSYYQIDSNGQHYTYGDVLRFADLDSFDQSSLNPGAEIAERIRKAYIQRGYNDVKIAFQQTADDQAYVKHIYVNITEGPRTRIQNIQVAGRLSRPSKYYRKFIEHNSSDAVQNGLYVQDDLALGYRNLITELNNQGYLRATLQSTRAEFNSDRTLVSVQVLLDEGPLTQIKDLKFAGNVSYQTPVLLNILKLYPNSPLRLNQLENGLQKIKDHYHNSGYLEMAITNERTNLVTYDEKGYEASILVNIQEGPKVMVREILVEGNSFTKDYVVRKEINIEIGDVLTPNVIEEAQKRLDRLNIFSRVEIRTLEANSNVSQRTLVVTVAERNPGTFRMGLGVTNKRELTVRGFTGVSYNNLAGTARAISLRVNAENNLVLEKYLEYEVLAGYLEPFLFGTRIRGRLNLSTEEKVSTTTNSIQRSNKVALIAERDITSKIRFSWNTWSLESVEYFEGPNSLPGFVRSQTQIATVGPLLDIDYRDNPFLPTRGTFTRLEADYSSPSFGSSDQVEFARYQGTFTFYQSLGSPHWVWANSMRGGYAKNLSKLPDSGIPLSYAFVLGGYTTIRGYSGVDDDQIPSSSTLGITTDTNKLVVPNDTDYVLYKSELRYPIWGIVGGVVFYDGGRVNIDGLAALENDPNPWKQAAGVGIRVNTPVGPISLDYARKIDARKDESPDHIHLSIGTF